MWSLMTAFNFVLGLGERKTAAQLGNPSSSTSSSESTVNEEDDGAAEEDQNENERENNKNTNIVLATATSTSSLADFHTSVNQTQCEVPNKGFRSEQNPHLALPSRSNVKSNNEPKLVPASSERLNENLSELTDEEILEQIENGELTFYNLEQQLNDTSRAVAIRRRFLGENSSFLFSLFFLS
jgi:hypothetical protein